MCHFRFGIDTSSGVAKVLLHEPEVARGRFSDCKGMWPVHFEQKENFGGTLARATSLYSLVKLYQNLSSIWR